jgi:peptidyl-prolyl cis-trans isomerase D
LRDKKFELLKEKLTGATLEEVAKNVGVEVTSFTNAGLDDFGVGDLIIEPRVVGAVATTNQTGTLSAPIMGITNAVVFVVDDIVKSDARTAEAERVRLQATNENINMQTSPVAMQQMAKLEDLRGQYF